jgi:hypothetical protein
MQIPLFSLLRVVDKPYIRSSTKMQFLADARYSPCGEENILIRQ